MDMDRSQTGGKVGSLLTVIEAADPDIIGNRIPQLIQCLDQIHGNKVIGADKGLRHRFEPTDGFVQGCWIVLLSRWHRTGAQAFCQTKVLHCILISHIALKEGLTVVFIPRKADAFFAALDHVGHRMLDLNAVFHIKAVGFQRRTHLHHRGVYKQQRNIQIAQHLCVVIVEHFKADDASCALDVERRWKFFLFKRHWQLYLLFLLPAVALTLVFKYAPMGGVLIAFQKYNPFRGIWGSEWVGFKNFTRFMSSPDFQRYLINTLKLSVYGLLWGFPIPILLAFLLNRIESKKIKQKVQLVLYMPNFISVIVLCGIVRVLLSVTGPVNGLLHTSINFMTLPEAFRPIYIISGIWQGAGWASIMYTASLSNASKDLKEAAMIDGANLIQQIMTVEWPAIKDMVVIQFILQAGNIMSIGFEKAYALQTDLNLNTAEIIATYVYKKGLLDGDYSFSTAVGLFNTIVNVILLIAVNKIVAKMNDGKGL